MSRLKQLIHEIHRRSLWQVLGIYLAASWVVFEAVKTLTEALGLPPWFPPFAFVLLLVGLPIVLATAFVQEGHQRGVPSGVPLIDAAGHEIEHHRRTPHSMSRARRLLTWRNAATGGVLAFALWGVVAAGWVVFGSRAGAAAAGSDNNASEAGIHEEIRSPGAADAPRLDRKTVAVLPFEDLSRTPEAAAFTEGIHSDLIVALSGVGALRVISRGSVLPYRERTRPPRAIADELGADVLVEGGVQRLGDRVRVNVQLTDPRSGELLWGDSYSRELSVENLFGIQGQIVERVAASLEASLSAAERERAASLPTEHLTAYQYFHQARLASDGVTRTGNEESERLLRLALEVDPRFADAWAALGIKYGWRAPYLGVSTSAWDSAMAFAERALRLDPDHAGGHVAMAVAYGHRGFLARQEEAARRALELNPSDDLAMRRLAESHRERGRFLEALRLHGEAVRLSPNNLVHRSWVGHAYTDLGAFGHADRWYRDVLALNPSYFHPLWGLASLHLRAGRSDSARHYAERMTADSPDETVPLTAGAMIFHYLGDSEAVARHAGRAVKVAGSAPAREIHSLLATTLLGFAERHSGNPGRAHALFDRSLEFLESMVAAGTDTPRWPYEIALIHAVRGEVAGALDWLETAYESGFRWAWMLEREPMLDPLRPNPRFRGLLARMRADVGAMRAELEREDPPRSR